jgi:renalase
MKGLGPVAIIGAGLSGLSCAQALRLAGVEVRVFERSNRTGGRCATQLWQGHLVDYGVQYFTAQTAEFKKELLTNLRQFRPLVPPILDVEQKVVYSDGGPRFYVLQGNNYFAHVLSHGLDVRLNTPVERICFRDDGIECLGETYRAAVSSLPAPQTAEVFALDQPATEYTCCLAAVLEYNESNVGESQDCYGRILPEGAEPLAASYCENHKLGRILSDKTVFVLQGAPLFSAAHADERSEDYIPELARAHEELWKIPSGKRTASFGHRWCWARPHENTRRPFKLPRGAFVCGDSRSESKVEEVWLDGRRAAEEVLAYLAA